MMLRAMVSLQQMAMPWEVGRGAHCDHGLERRWSVARVEELERPLFCLLLLKEDDHELLYHVEV
jgi:hypothetical protein